ncbi:NAD(P)-dependent alcohol dehydrogenase [Streptomyces sp. 4N509B]|uniref:NAD(P)-dependent alcohol dehydrogenase n=1 Tax=Streptomyces sp. 4N509B TaxID=3457413 RepID=UPI003FD640B5
MANQMRAARYHRYGPPEVLRVEDAPLPRPGRGDVLVRVRATSVNPSETLVRAGKLRLLSGFRFPKGTGQDFAGEVVAVGPGANPGLVGGRVWGTRLGLGSAAAAEYVSVPARLVAAAPDGLGPREAAALPTVGLSALMALRMARVRDGSTVLVVGASGGVGSAAVQLARAAGAEVATVSSPANTDFCVELGAHTAYAYTQPDALGTATFDAVVDLHGRGLAAYRRRVRRGGRMVSLSPRAMAYALGSAPRPGPTVRLGQLRPKAADLDLLARHVAAGELRAVVDRVYPLTDIAAAHRDLETGHSRGKRVVAVTDDQW